MKNEVNKKCMKDCIAIIFVVIIMWTVLTFVIVNIINILDSSNLRIIIPIIGILVGIFATSSSIAVINHLRKNKNYLYYDETKEERL